LVKVLARRYFRHLSIIELHKAAKFLVELNKHPQSNKGNFGLVKDFEDHLVKELNSPNGLKFDNLVKVSEYIFSENLCTNNTQSAVEKHIILKFEKKIKIDMSRVVKLCKSLANYYIKNEQLCFSLKNYIETYLNGYIGKENKDEISKNINVEFSEGYYKLITNLNIIIWAIAKNDTFLRLAKQDTGFEYFFSRLKEIFIRNLEFYNERETSYALDGLLKMKVEFNEDEVKLLSKKITELKDYVPHDSVVLLRNLILRKIGTKESILHLITLSYKNFEKLTYTELIDFIDILTTIPEVSMTLINDKKISFYEMRLLAILPKTDIKAFCQVIKLTNKLNVSSDFYESLKNVFNSRANEIPKESFGEVLFALVNLKYTDGVLKLIDILEDLSNFENLEEVFKQPSEQLNLLWSCLTMNMNVDKGNTGQKKFINKYIDNVLKYEGNPEGYIDELVKRIRPESFIYKTDDYPVYDYEINVIKCIQTLYLSVMYIIDKYQVDKKIFTELNDKLATWVNILGQSKLTNIINNDPASRCDKDILDDLQNELLKFFQKKANASLYPNFIDPALNPLNIVIKFILPRLTEDQYVTGIDAKNFGVILLNQDYFSPDKQLLSVYENRFKMLQEVFDWDIIKINEEEWVRNTDKQILLRSKFGFDFSSAENISIQIKKGEQLVIEDHHRPKYNLAKKILSKKK
jgi:hypothetical protein